MPKTTSKSYSKNVAPVMLSKVIRIYKRDGRLVPFDESKIYNALHKAFTAVREKDGASVERVSKKVVANLEKMYVGKTPSVEEIQDVIVHTLLEEKFDDVTRAYSDYRKKRQEIREAKYFLLYHDVKTTLTANALKVLESRYLRKDENGKIIETPQELFRRIASNIAAAEKIYDPNISDEDLLKTEEKFYRLIASLEFLPNSPTIMNAGTPMQQLSACFVLPVEDSMISIFDSAKATAIIHQSGGGTGYHFGRLRPQGDIVRSTGGIASGPVSFMRVFDMVAEVVKQGGRRRGAMMGILRVDHPDILQFITAKSEEGILRNFNISVAVTRDFMDAVKKGKKYKLINPRSNQVVRELDARETFNLIVKLAWETGDPGVVFIERMNNERGNPTPRLGQIEATNPCVVGGTLVSTKNGLERIEHLYKIFIKKHRPLGIITDNRISPLFLHRAERSRVLSRGTAEIVPEFILNFRNSLGTGLHRAVSFYNNGLRPVATVKTKDGFEVTATYDHKILTCRGWMAVGDLKTGDKILIQSGAGQFSRNYNLPFRVSRLGLMLPRQWSLELGRVLGWLVGDGWLRSGDKNCRAGFVFGRGDRPILDYLKHILNKWYGNSVREIRRENGVYHLSYHSQKLVDFFKNLGVEPGRASHKHVPESLFTAPYGAVVGFLQGLFSADGTVNFVEGKSSYVRLTSKSRKLLGGVQMLLLNLGIFSRIYDRSREARESFRYLTISGESKTYISDGVCFELEISRSDVLEFFKIVGFLGDKHSFKIKKFSDKTFYSRSWESEVVEIEPAGVKTVYDLTEPITSSFIGNGLVLHNCGEQPLLPNEPCNLGSIDVNKLTKKIGRKYETDWVRLKKTVWDAVHFLDNVIDMNRYPIPEIQALAQGNRRIGLGIMGWADLLVSLEIPYGSHRALVLAEKLMGFIEREAHAASCSLAKKRGVFPNFKGSVYDRTGGERLRNCAVTTIAPTGTIGIIAGCSQGIEPKFALAYVRKSRIAKGEDEWAELVEIDKQLEETAKREKFYSEKLMKEVAKRGSLQEIESVPAKWKKIFVTAHGLKPEEHVRMQAVFQKYVDNAVSKTINFPVNATIDDVKRAYMLAWETGCKGITIYRDQSKSVQVLNLPKDEGLFATTEPKVELDTNIRTEVEVKDPENSELPPGICLTCN